MPLLHALVCFLLFQFEIQISDHTFWHDSKVKLHNYLTETPLCIVLNHMSLTFKLSLIVLRHNYNLF